MPTATTDMERKQLIWVYTFCMIAGLSAKVLVKDGCAQGPEFWCQDLVTAAQCGAIDHCKDNVWKEAEEPICTQCKQVVTILVNMVKTSPIQGNKMSEHESSLLPLSRDRHNDLLLRSPLQWDVATEKLLRMSLQDTVKKFLHKECSHLTVEPLITKCHQLVDQYQDILMTMLENQINPNAICSSLSICEAGQSETWNPEFMAKHVMENLMPLIQESLFNAHSKATMDQDAKGDFPIPLPLCYLCKTLIGRIESTLPKEAIGKSASKLCLFLPGKIAGVCQCLIEKYTVILLDFILGKVGPQLVCGLLFMCVTEDNCAAGLPVIPGLSSDVTCDTCLAVTSSVKPKISANITQGEIEVALLRACTDHAVDLKQCQGFLQQHQTQLLQLLHKPWDHKITCQEVGACQDIAKPVLENSGCAAGPLYWCKSLDTAKECDAVGHCLKHVWL